MHIDFLIERFRRSAAEPAIVWRDAVTGYGWLADEIQRLEEHVRGAVAVGRLQWVAHQAAGGLWGVDALTPDARCTRR